MKDKKLLVQVGCTSREFYIFKPKPGADYHIKFRPPAEVRDQLGIETVFKTTGHTLEAPAKQEARRIIESYWQDRRTLEVPAVIEAKTKARGEFATLGEIVQRYRDGARTIENKENMDRDTVKANIRALMVIVETRFDEAGNRTRRAGSGQTMRVNKALDPELWNDFKSGWLRSVNHDDETAVDRAKRTVNSYIAQGRSLFGEEFLPLYKGLRLPDLAEFRKVKRFKQTWDTRYRPISQDVIEAMRESINDMRTERPDWYLAFYFALYLGMRREEICAAKLGWIERTIHGNVMKICKRADFTPKGIAGDVPISDWLLGEIRELSGAKKRDDYLIPATTPTNRIKNVQRKLTKFLHRFMPDRIKPLHELRKHACTLMLMQTNGNFALAQKFSRHADKDTLLDVYAAVVQQIPALDSVAIQSPSLRVLPKADAA